MSTLKWGERFLPREQITCAHIINTLTYRIVKLILALGRGLLSAQNYFPLVFFNFFFLFHWGVRIILIIRKRTLYFWMGFFPFLLVGLVWHLCLFLFLNSFLIRGGLIVFENFFLLEQIHYIISQI